MSLAYSAGAPPVLNQTNLLPIGRFYGAGVTRWTSDAACTELVHEKARTVPEHVHEAPYFCLLLGGTYREWSAARDLTYRPMTLTYHPPGLAHADEIGRGGARFFMVELGASWLPQIAALGATHEHLTELHDTDALWTALRLQRTLAGGDDDDRDTCAGPLLHELVSHAAPAPALGTRAPAWLESAERTLRRRFAEPLDLASVAAENGVHPGHLARAFRRFRRRTVGAFVMHLRLRDACRRLSETDAPLAHIAVQSGFADQSHLTRALSARLGETPGRYRRALDPAG